MGEFQTRYLTENEYNNWDRFVDQSEYGTIFHKSHWNRAIFKIDPLVSIRIIGCFKGETLIAGVIVGIRKKFGKISIVVPPYASIYYGLLINERKTAQITKAESYRKSVLDALLDFVEDEFHIISFSLFPDLIDIRPFSWREYSSRVMYTYRGRIKAPEEQINQILPDLKRRITRGKELQFTITDSSSLEDIGIAFDLIHSSFHNQKHKFGFSKEQFLDFISTPELKDIITIHTIWWEEKPIATIILIIDGSVAYYWLAGGDHNFFKTGLNQVLMWHVIEFLHAMGISIFDLVGANTPTISFYKSGFNFDLVPYYLVSKESSKIASRLMVIKKLLKGS